MLVRCRASVGVNLRYSAQADLGLFVSPQFEWDYETGASESARSFGAVLGATKVFSRDLILGLGAGVLLQIDAESGRAACMDRV